MIVDLKKVTLGMKLDDGTLWVIEQIPGLVVGADQTTILRAGRYLLLYCRPIVEFEWKSKSYHYCHINNRRLFMWQ